MLHYLGDHVLMLTSMNLRDYLRLKVEIHGTSGEGSKAVKSFRSANPLQSCLWLDIALGAPDGLPLEHLMLCPLSI